ncbi:MAG: LLM class flavin-dependent oxidoreductase [Gammaproteobacteria bacterium]|nr:LLM class flavin-dependent oxidoreductase [Gammaproteobacteria bacterium]
MAKHGVHLGLTPWLISSEADAQSLGRQGALAESWGYESFWLPESHFVGDGAIPEPLMMLASVAAHTQRLRLATTSFLLPLRHPLQAAEQVAVLDRLSNGRVTLGVGRGYQPAMFSAFNISRKDKRRIFEWCLETMIKAWSGEAVALHEDAEPVILSPLPVQRPHPPIWVAAFGPKALAQAGSLGLPYIASPMEPIARLQENYGLHREACINANSAQPAEVPVMRTVFVSDDARLVSRVREKLEHQAREMSRTGLRKGMSIEVDDWALIGDRARVRDQVARYVDELGVTHLIVTRLRIGHLDAVDLENSVATMAELMG